MILLVHSSLRSFDPVGDRAETLFGALRDVIGPEGTIVVPTFTPGNSRSSDVYRIRTNRLSDEELAEYHRSMPAFDPLTTPSTGMGQFSEYVRTVENSVRSAHPQTSFAAIGADAQLLMAEHDRRCHLGEESPLAVLYRMHARILMVGVGYGKCSAFHLAEYRYSPYPPEQIYECVIKENGHRRWLEYADVRLDDSDFEELGSALECAIDVSQGTFCGAEIRSIPIRQAVDFAARWLAENRKDNVLFPSLRRLDTLLVTGGLHGRIRRRSTVLFSELRADAP
jgi:aminoglycoside 3-N-acetyltransferase